MSKSLHWGATVAYMACVVSPARAEPIPLNLTPSLPNIAASQIVLSYDAVTKLLTATSTALVYSPGNVPFPGTYSLNATVDAAGNLLSPGTISITAFGQTITGALQVFGYNPVGTAKLEFTGLITGNTGAPAFPVGTPFGVILDSQITDISFADSFPPGSATAGVTSDNFPLTTHTLTVTAAGIGSGTVTSQAGLVPPIICTVTDGTAAGTCQGYAFGTTVTLTAVATPGSSFVGWSGAGCSGTTPCVITLNADTTVTASFGTLPPLTSPTGVGVATPPAAAPGDVLGLRVTVSPGVNPTSTGLAVAVDASALGGSVALSLADTGSAGACDNVAGDLVFGACVSVGAATTAGTKVLPVTITDAEGRSGTATIAVTVGTSTDRDLDGLPNTWEIQYGLDPAVDTGADGATGDPDGDGETNADEYTAGTHPRGFETRYFAEGSTGDFFDLQLALVNPSATTTATVLIGFQKPDGTRVPFYLTIPPFSRRTASPEALAGLEATAFSSVIESDIPVIADRTMIWGGGYGSHAETSVETPATKWYLAEGATHSGFQLFYLLQNPGAATAHVQVEYLLPAPRLPIIKTYTVGAGSRENVWVNTEPELTAVDVSAVVTSDVDIIVERAMYLNRPGQTFAAGHESAGLTAAAIEWFLAEGATGGLFDLFVLIANPNAATAQIAAKFLLPDGTVIERYYPVEGKSRFNVWVDAEGGPLADTAVSTTITSTNGVPVLVERAMWWPGPTAETWAEAHNSPGATSVGTLWALAEGECGPDVETYVLVANASSFDGLIKGTLLFEDDTPPMVQFFVAPETGRFNIVPPVDFPAACQPGVTRRFGMLVESLASGPNPPAQIVVERAMYSDANGIAWAAGTNAVGTRLK